MNGADIELPRLLIGEKIVKVKYFKEQTPIHSLSSLRAIEGLAKAKNYRQIGEFGPVMAAKSLKDHDRNSEFQRYSAIFGRDSLRVAIDLVSKYPKLAETTLIKLAELQGVKFDILSEEEPGRIIHEARDPKIDPIARQLTKQLNWKWPYYGSVDATPEFIRTLIAYCKFEKDYKIMTYEYVNRAGEKCNIANALSSAVSWILNRLSANKEGLLEFKRANPNGIENQAWKDSWDSYFHADGKIANHKQGIASVEVQRVTVDALLDAASYYELGFDKSHRVQELKERANHLSQQIAKYFWIDELGGYFVLGTDRDHRGQLRQLAVRTSNMGHLLHSQLLKGNDIDTTTRRHAVISQLFSPELLSASGIRTLASNELRFRPGAYHNGSVWTWDNYLILQGLENHGYYGLANFLRKILLKDITVVHRLPEYFRGDLDNVLRLNTRLVEVYDDINKRFNTLEQPPQDVQAWTAAAILAIKLKRHLPVFALEVRKKNFEKKILSQVTFIES